MNMCSEFIVFEQMFKVRLTIMMPFLYRSMFKTSCELISRTSRESLTSLGFQFQHVQENFRLKAEI